MCFKQNKIIATFVAIAAFSVFSLMNTGCGKDEVTVPKPRVFPKVNYPTGKMIQFDTSFCSFTFEYPSYISMKQDTLYFDEAPKDPCWFDLYYPDFDAKIHCSYYPISTQNPFEKLRSDAYTLASKHNIKADYIEEFLIKDDKRDLSGVVFDLEGNVASPFQFFLTDSTKHFLRGALYFNTKSRQDSLAPVTNFVRKDIMHIINTFHWK
ncbi:MAG: hypothetical protein KBA06_02260 [Saprospiraceae bacterium]|nr:hypothetical protein [Saprospiraceae bacterium]